MAISEKMALALDESTPETVLHQIWNDSRSATVRKAVARNPNAGPVVLKAASRLYLEEVLENPGFAVLELFDEDPWIKRLSLAYADPDEFVNTYVSSTEAINEPLLWACLLSPKLTSNALDRVVQALSLTLLRRAFSNKKVSARAKELYESSLTSADTWPFDLGSSLTLYTERVISAEQLYIALSNHGIYSTSARKSTFIKFFEDVAEQYSETKEEFYAKMLARLFLVVRAHALNWLGWRFRTSKSYNSGGELFTHILSHMVSVSSAKQLTKSCFKTLGEFVSTHMNEKFFRTEHGDYECTPERLAQAYQFLKAHNLTQVFSNDWDLLLEAQRSFTIEALAQCDLEVKEFFVKKKCVGDWAVIDSKDPKHLLFEEVNNAIFKKEGVSQNLLFNNCSLKKIINLCN